MNTQAATQTAQPEPVINDSRPVLYPVAGVTYHTWTHRVGAGIGYTDGWAFHTSGNITPAKELLAGAARVSIKVGYTVHLQTSKVKQVHNRTEWAHSWKVNLRVTYGNNTGGHDYQLFLVLSHNDLKIILDKLCRKLVALHKQNPDRFALLFVSDLPTLPKYKWCTYVVDRVGAAGVFKPVNPDEDAHHIELFLISGR